MAFINRLCIKMRIIHHKPPLSPLTTVCVHHFLSLSVMCMTFPYVLPGEMPKKFNLNTQILSFMVASNSRHLSEGSFFLFFFSCTRVFVSMSVGMFVVMSIHCQISALMCNNKCRCECTFPCGWLCSTGFSEGLLCSVVRLSFTAYL